MAHLQAYLSAMTRRMAVLGAALVVLAVAGCSGGSDDSGGAPSATTTPAAAGAERQVVSTASLRVRVGDVRGAIQRAVAVVEGAGGYVGEQQVELEGSERAEVTFRVPPAALPTVLDRIGGLGRVLDRSSKAQDVTEQVVDSEGRLKTLRASADRLRALIADARIPAEIIGVESELARREADIESTEGRLRVLRDQVGLAAVRVSFTERGAPARSKDIPGFLAGLKAGWAALVNTLGTGATVLGALLPFAPPVAVVIWGTSRRRRRRVFGAEAA
jgi:hypothetical protein